MQSIYRRGCILFLVLCGTACPKQTAAPFVAPPTEHKGAAISTQQTPSSPVGILLNLCSMISGRARTAIAVANELGGVQEDYGGNFQVGVRVSDPAIQSEQVIRTPDTGLADSIDITLAAPISVAALAASLGPYRESRRSHWDSPLELSFKIDKQADSVVCTISATLDPSPSSIPQGQARKFIIMRR